MDRIVLYPDSVLRKLLPPSQLSVREAGKIISRLVQVMHQETHGIGIAAPQIGISERIAIVDISVRQPAAKRIVLINPELLETKDLQVGREGCMSLPDYTALVKRYRWIRYRYQNDQGQTKTQTATGIEAVCVQHEIDHLNGKLIIDCVTCLKTDLLPRKWPNSR